MFVGRGKGVSLFQPSGVWVDEQSVVNLIPYIIARSLGLVYSKNGNWVLKSATGEVIPIYPY